MFIRFLHAEWQSIGYATVLEGKELFLTVDEECHRLTSLRDEKITALYTDQEEADGRMLLHAKNAAQHGHNTIIIRSLDTDVEVLALYHQDRIESQLFLVTGAQQKPRIVDITSLANALGQNVCKSLLGLRY